jgi:hypothetical protein
MTLVWRCGLRHLESGAAVVADQMRHAHAYYNALIAIERARRARVAGGEDRAASRAWAAGEIRAARKMTPTYWGTYLLVEAAAEAACKRPDEPKFRAWAVHDGAGRLGVQCQGGVDLATILAGTDRRLWIEAVRMIADRPVSGRYDPARGVGRSRLHFRVGSDASGRPIWAVWQLIVDRPWPIGARVKQATVVRRIVRGRTGPGRWRDELHLTLEVPEEAVVDQRMRPGPERQQEGDGSSPFGSSRFGGGDVVGIGRDDSAVDGPVAVRAVERAEQGHLVGGHR